MALYLLYLCVGGDLYMNNKRQIIETYYGAIVLGETTDINEENGFNEEGQALLDTLWFKVATFALIYGTYIGIHLNTSLF